MKHVYRLSIRLCITIFFICTFQHVTGKEGDKNARTDYDEARVRYIMADNSLGGPLSFYKGYLNKPNPAEAVRRWEHGVRVTNRDRFERHVEGGGPGIVYARTRKVIDGMDVKLSTD